MEKSSIRRQVIAGTIATLAALPAGFHNGWTSPSLVKLQAKDSDLPVTSDQGAWIATVYFLAGLFTPFLICTIANKWGRKPALFLAMIPTVIACILIATARNWWWILIARLAAGLGFGGSVPIILMYLAEIATDRIRGALGALYNQMTSVGMLLTYCIGPWTSRVALAGVGLALPIIFAVPFVWMPESPYYLTMKNRPEAAEKSLTWLRGTGEVKEELRKVEETIKNEEQGTLKELIMTPGNRKALVIITILMMAPHASGINAILAYSGLIFEESGTELSSSISVIVIGIVQLGSGIFSILTVDIAGRRPLLLMSSGGSTLFLLAEGLYFQLQAIGIDLTSISWLPTTAMVGYIVFFSLGLGCIPFVVVLEIIPCNLKAVSMTYAISITAITCVIVTKLYQVIADAYGTHASFYVFAASSLVFTFSIYFVLPETKQKSFGVIQDELRNSVDSK